MKKFLEITGFVFSCIWECIMSFTAPVCIGYIYMEITGNNPVSLGGFGGKKDIFVFIGIIALALWLGLLLPNSIFLFQRLKSLGARYIIIGLIVIIIFFIAGILATGGFSSFLAYFAAKEYQS